MPVSILSQRKQIKPYQNVENLQNPASDSRGTKKTQIYQILIFAH